jgi:membrane protease YdiL (CAAX protease family)
VTKENHWKTIALCIIFFSIGLIPHGMPHRLIFQIAAANITILIAYSVYSKCKPDGPIFSNPVGLAIGFLITALFSTLTYGVLYLTTQPNLLDNYFTSDLLFSSLVFSASTSTFEEFIFRGPLLLIQKIRFQSRLINASMITLQALLFGAAHYNPYRPIIFCLSAFTLGLLLGLISLHLRSLWIGIGLHAGLNFVACIANGIHLGSYMNLPGALSFDDAGNTTKIAITLIFPLAGLAVYFSLKIHRTKLQRALC